MCCFKLLSCNFSLFRYCLYIFYVLHYTDFHDLKNLLRVIDLPCWWEYWKNQTISYSLSSSRLNAFLRYLFFRRNFGF